MSPLGIRARILLAAVAPALLVALLITTLLVAEHFRQSQLEQHRRLGAVARQLAAAAEFNLFAGNTEEVQRLLATALDEPDVVAAVLLDPYGRVLASTVGIAGIPRREEIRPEFSGVAPATEGLRWHGQPVRASILADFDPLYDVRGETANTLLGELLIQVSNRSLQREMQNFAIKAAFVALLVVAFGLFLGALLARGLIGTLADIGRVVEAIRHGRRDIRTPPGGHDELGRLAQGINEMADAVSQTEETLTARIAAATADLRRERDAVEAAAQVRSRFFAAASHDLRQPVQALGLFVAQLTRDARRSPLLPRIRQVEGSVSNLHELLDSLLDYARHAGTADQVEKGAVSAARMLARLARDCAPVAAEKRVDLRLRGGDCWLLTDAIQLHRILINLVGNAIRHAGAGDSVLLACRRGRGHARIEVWDTGPGIPAEHQEAIFDELVQLNNPERDRRKGLGLGLAIVRHTADRLQHPLALCSRPGHGTRFSLTIPLAEPPGDSPGPAGEESFANPRRRLLLIGIGTALRAELLPQIERGECATVSSNDFAAAAAWIAAHDPPDGVICAASTTDDLDATQAALDSLETVGDCSLPAIIVVPGPTAQLAPSPRATLRLALPHPFRPARLRALLNRLLSGVQSVD